MRPFDIHALLEGLAEKRPLFCSEADFQFALAWEIRKKTEREVRLEFPPLPRSRKRMYLDLWLPRDKVAIELKYFTKALEINVSGELFVIREQGAQDLSRYDFLKDLVRLEQVVLKSALARRGMAVLLTNDPLFWKPPTRKTIDAAFRLHRGRPLSGAMAWSETASPGSTRGREDPLVLTDSYRCEWRNYGPPIREAPGRNNKQFRYLAVEVGR